MTAAEQLPVTVDRYLDLRADYDDPDADPHTVAVTLPTQAGVEWFIYAVPVAASLLDDASRTPMQVALDVGRSAKDIAESVIHPAIVERRQAASRAAS